MKSKKGFSLIESLAAVAIFVIAMAAVLCVYMSLETALKRQREYVAFEGICLDIGFYGDRYGRNWADEYFSGVTTYGDGINTLCCYNSSYLPTSQTTEAEYTLSYYYSDGGSLMLCVNRADGESVIPVLDYGPARYDEKYLDILNMLSVIKENAVAEDYLRPVWAANLLLGYASEANGENGFAYYLDESLAQTDESNAVYALYYKYVLSDGVNTLYVSVENIRSGYCIIDEECCGEV